MKEYKSNKDKGICPICDKNYDNSNYEKEWDFKHNYLYLLGECQHCGADIVEGYEVRYSLTTGVVRQARLRDR